MPRGRSDDVRHKGQALPGPPQVDAFESAKPHTLGRRLPLAKSIVTSLAGPRAYYDPAVGRWLPTPSASISPDRTR